MLSLKFSLLEPYKRRNDNVKQAIPNFVLGLIRFRTYDCKMALNNRLLIYIVEVVFFLLISCSADDNCETVPSEIHVTKGNFIIILNFELPYSHVIL